MLSECAAIATPPAPDPLPPSACVIDSAIANSTFHRRHYFKELQRLGTNYTGAPYESSPHRVTGTPKEFRVCVVGDSVAEEVDIDCGASRASRHLSRRVGTLDLDALTTCDRAPARVNHAQLGCAGCAVLVVVQSGLHLLRRTENATNMFGNPGRVDGWLEREAGYEALTTPTSTASGVKPHQHQFTHLARQLEKFAKRTEKTVVLVGATSVDQSTHLMAPEHATQAFGSTRSSSSTSGRTPSER